MEFKLTKVLNGSAVGGGGVQTGEDGIKVDRFSSKDIVPFHVKKFRYSFGAENPKFFEFKVNGMVLDHFSGKFLAVSEEDILGCFRCEPGEEIFIRGSLFLKTPV